MLKHPLPDRTDAYRTSDAPSERLLAAARESARGDRYTVTASAEAVGSWIKRQHYHRIVSGQPLDVQTPADRPHRHVRNLRRALGETVLDTRRTDGERSRRPLHRHGIG